MGIPAPMVGRRFGRLVVIERVGSDKNSKALWLCRCDCGNEVLVNTCNLNSGNTKSCGCFRIEVCKRKSTIPGGHYSRLYRVWMHMRERCSNKNNKRYSRYGGRGIKVCEEWQKFMTFYEWAVSNGYRENLTIERIDNNGGYCPQNCKWIPMVEQAKNRSNNHYIEYNGETHTIADWARIVGISERRLWYRINARWPLEKALMKNRRRKNEK